MFRKSEMLENVKMTLELTRAYAILRAYADIRKCEMWANTFSSRSAGAVHFNCSGRVFFLLCARGIPSEA